MDDYEKALMEEMEKRPHIESLIYHAGASWAKEWLMNSYSMCPSCGEEFVQLVQDPETNRLRAENQRLREALEKIEDSTSAIKDGRNIPYSDWELRLIARQALREVSE